MDNYPTDKAIAFDSCLDFFEQNVLFTLHCVFDLGEQTSLSATKDRYISKYNVIKLQENL